MKNPKKTKSSKNFAKKTTRKSNSKKSSSAKPTLVKTNSSSPSKNSKNSKKLMMSNCTVSLPFHLRVHLLCKTLLIRLWLENKPIKFQTENKPTKNISAIPLVIILERKFSITWNGSIWSNWRKIRTKRKAKFLIFKNDKSLLRTAQMHSIKWVRILFQTLCKKTTVLSKTWKASNWPRQKVVTRWPIKNRPIKDSWIRLTTINGKKRDRAKDKSWMKYCSKQTSTLKRSTVHARDPKITFTWQRIESRRCMNVR